MKITSSKQFVDEARKAVFEMAKQGFDPTDHVEFTIDDVYVVNSSYVLGNQKAQLSTTLPDGKYYEVTYNVSAEEMYVDMYVKIGQNIIK